MKKSVLRFICVCFITLFMLTAVASAASTVTYGFMKAGASVKAPATMKGVPVGKWDWSTSDATVAKYTGSSISALSQGNAKITASYAGKNAIFDITVFPSSITITQGETYALPRAGVESYVMQSKKTASISKTGTIKGLKAGKTKLKIKYRKQVVNLDITVNAAAAPQSAAAELECASSARQIVLVDYKSGSSATLSIHEKQNGVWKQLYSCSACLGKNGIGKTKEGDKKTPAGTFNLTMPFGIKKDPGSKMDYTQVTKNHYWCSTSGSEYYNQLVDTRITDRACTSSDENLIKYKGSYDYCMFIDYNAQGIAGKGSAIFLHCKNNAKSTAGCVAVDTAAMKKILQWAEPGCKIVIR